MDYSKPAWASGPMSNPKWLLHFTQQCCQHDNKNMTSCLILLKLWFNIVKCVPRGGWWEVSITSDIGLAPTNISFKRLDIVSCTVCPKKYAHGFCFAVLCCGYTLTDFPISTRLTSLALRQSNDCPSASKATLMNRDKYFMWIHCERLHNHNKAKHNKTVCIFLGIYCKTI